MGIESQNFNYKILMKPILEKFVKRILKTDDDPL